MNIKYVSGFAAALISLCVISASALSAKTAPTEKHNHAHVHFVKPGAAVSLTHDYDGKLSQGGLITLTVTLNHIYQDGFLTANAVPSSGMQIISGAQPVKSYLSEGSEVTLYVQVSAPEQGEHFLGIETVYEDPAGEQTRRVFSIPMTAASNLNEKSQAITSQTPKVKSTKLISLPAQESIR